jgi:hypothetical protein
VLLLVPLGDVLDRRRFLPVMLLASAAALLLCALAPSIGVLLLAPGVLGVTTISGQVLTPLAVESGAQRERQTRSLAGCDVSVARLIATDILDRVGWADQLGRARRRARVDAMITYALIGPHDG